jgi:hypothetical protein
MINEHICCKVIVPLRKQESLIEDILLISFEHEAAGKQLYSHKK